MCIYILNIFVIHLSPNEFELSVICNYVLNSGIFQLLNCLH